ncbi:hypothetical protein [Microvirga lotononidis]|uniref:hypothetical protein n=1 Tax=Microvirga lotononidis TaxID=864069 RepID=UPI00058CEA4E|nr:hypothetical protein [Microvirga lotononidis]WQO26768.1 hypothetical protein U0023_19200 [Microvirga lotononidis]
MRKLIMSVVGAGIFAILAFAVWLDRMTAGFQELFPEAVSWENKNAYLKCEGAVDGALSWPSQPAVACRAMHMCANEAQLSAELKQSLMQAIRSLSECQDP